MYYLIRVPGMELSLLAAHISTTERAMECLSLGQVKDDLWRMNQLTFHVRVHTYVCMYVCMYVQCTRLRETYTCMCTGLAGCNYDTDSQN